jgi:hypothetical protein
MKSDPSGGPGRLNEKVYSDSFRAGLVRACYCRWCNSSERLTSLGYLYCHKCDIGKPYDWAEHGT